MLSFIGWEAVSHLAGELRDPARQLPRAILSALAVVVVLYLGLAVATVGVLGTSAPSASARRPDGRRARPDRAHRHRGTRRAAHDGHHERLRGGGGQARRGARRRTLGAACSPGRAAPPPVRVGALLLATLGTGLLGVDGLVRATSARSWRCTSRRRRPRRCSAVRRGSRPGSRSPRSWSCSPSRPVPGRAGGRGGAVLLPYLWSAITPASRSTAVSSSCSPR